MAFEGEYRKIKAKSEFIRSANEAWSKDFEILQTWRKKGQESEKSQDYLAAIEFYKICIQHGKGSDFLTLANYVHDINRIIILYTKTRQISPLTQLLESLLLDYPKSLHVAEWQIRLKTIFKDHPKQM
ncbi:hypothetical protein KIH41_04170 [Litoribacter ruber]|uniref:hypothetical protein n=1 Tax=Litoribacter ruber TaxID=702568 RepID=UPI001BDA75B7|nr:hypothetical protein [Litoribacter ruber]MBT0810471.1 hypothetical protein [Litoribacter ruber]